MAKSMIHETDCDKLGNVFEACYPETIDYWHAAQPSQYCLNSQCLHTPCEREMPAHRRRLACRGMFRRGRTTISPTLFMKSQVKSAIKQTLCRVLLRTALRMGAARCRASTASKLIRACSILTVNR